MNTAWGQTFVVTNTLDSGAGSLRQAVSDANAASGGTILFSNVTGTITLTTGQLLITNNINIVGPGPAALAISGNNASRVFNINSNVTASISGLTISNGSSNPSSGGGGLYNAGTLTLTDCIVTGNSAGDDSGNGIVGGSGGGLYNAGMLTMSSCTVSNNSAGRGGYGSGGGGSGGGLYNAGMSTMSNCAFSANSAGNGEGAQYVGGAGGSGGGLYNTGTLTLTVCTVSGNSAGSGAFGQNAYDGNGGSGGGLYNTGMLALNGCTVSNNLAGSGGGGPGGSGATGGSGGGLYNSGTLGLTNCTVSANSAGNGGQGSSNGGSGGSGGGLYNNGTLTLAICTVSGNSAGSGGLAGNNGGSGGSGGGLYNTATLTLTTCNVSSNSAGSGGQGYNGPGNANGGNGGSGGGLYNAGMLTMSDCTFSANAVGAGGSGDGGGTAGSGGSGADLFNTGTILNCPTITLSPSTLPFATAGAYYSQTITASGGNGTYTYAETGTLPTGLALSSGGVLSGTPTISGIFPVTITATDQLTSCTSSQSYTLNVNCPTITLSPSSPLPNGTVTTPYSQTITATGGTGPYTFSVLDGALPSGLSLSAAGVLSGIPTMAGNPTFTLLASDAYGCSGTQQYTVAISGTFEITAITREGNDILVTWTCLDSHSYVLQSTKSTAMIASYNTNFVDVSPVISVPGGSPSTTNYLDRGVAYAPVLIPPTQIAPTSGVASLINSSAQYTRGLADSLGNAAPVGSVLMLGSFSISAATIQSNFIAGNVSAIMSNFTPYSTPFAVGNGTALPASWSVSQSATGFGGQQIYLLATDKPVLAAATHLGIFTAPSWTFPTGGGTNTIDLEDVTDFVIGAQGGPLTINLGLGQTYTFNDTARLSVMPGRILFYRVRLAQ